MKHPQGSGITSTVDHRESEMTAAAAYAARFDAVEAQAARLRAHSRTAAGSATIDDSRGGVPGRRVRVDPRRARDPEIALLASYLEPADVLVDVGGGSGRLGLPLALRCHEVINVEPSPRALAEFSATAAEAGITNVRSIQADWLAAEGVQGDVVLAAHVTYLVREIVRFVERLQAAARRRVMTLLSSAPLTAQADEQMV